MPITPAEHDTFYFITKLTRNLSPGHSVYVAREKDVNDMPLSYHAGVAKCKGEVMKYVLMDSGTADERINVLESLLGDLEDYAYDNFEQIEAEQRARDADSDAKISSSEEEDEAGKRKGKTLGGRGADKKPRLDISQSPEKGRRKSWQTHDYGRVAVVLIGGTWPQLCHIDVVRSPAWGWIP